MDQSWAVLRGFSGFGVSRSSFRDFWMRRFEDIFIKRMDFRILRISRLFTMCPDVHLLPVLAVDSDVIQAYQGNWKRESYLRKQTFHHHFNQNIPQRCHKRVQPMMIFHGLLTILFMIFSVKSAYICQQQDIIFCVLGGFLFLYKFIVLFSNHKTFKQEYQSGLLPTAQSSQPKFDYFLNQTLNSNEFTAGDKVPLIEE
jgi:hypothetical protein